MKYGYEYKCYAYYVNIKKVQFFFYSIAVKLRLHLVQNESNMQC